MACKNLGITISDKFIKDLFNFYDLVVIQRSKNPLNVTVLIMKIKYLSLRVSGNSDNHQDFF
jgi:hypothetical protein